jgi:hypothetical protein
MTTSRLRVENHHNHLIDAVCLIGLTLLILIITSLYITSERNFHWWIDWYERTLMVADAFRESPAEGIALIHNSLNSERNRLYTLPLIPFLWVFGQSRLVYEIALALVYLLPFALVMGAIATQLIRVQSRLVFWSTAFLTLLIPVNWIPTFMGIPDTGGATLMAMATYVYFKDVRLQQWWRIPFIGSAIGMAILVRRPFVYAGLTFIGALGLQALLFFVAEVRRQPAQTQLKSRLVALRPSLRTLLLTWIRIGLIGAMALATLAIVAPQFTYAALNNDYKTLYTSWTLPFRDIASLYGSFYGWGTWLLVILGFSASVMTRTLPLPALSFMGFSGILSLSVWLIVLRYGNVFYALQVTPFILIGLVALIWTSWIRLKGKSRRWMLGIVGCYLVGNLIAGLAPIGSISRAFHPLFVANMPPLVRTDYDEVVRLVNFLRQLTPNQEPIFVVGYQRLQLTSSMLRAAEHVMYPQDERFLNILVSPEVDSRDWYPLEGLLEAQYVVVPTELPDYGHDPTKLTTVGEWLPNQEYDVVNVAFDIFTQDWEFAQDFQRFPLQFQFENGVAVNVYQRIRPTALGTTVRTLHAMQRQIGERPGSQGDWIILSQWMRNTRIQLEPDYHYQLTAYRRDRSGNGFGDGYSLFDSLPLVRELGLHTSLIRDVEEPSLLELPKLSFVKQLRSQGLSPSSRYEELPPPSTDRTQQLGTSLLYLGSIFDRAQVDGVISYLDQDCAGSSLRLALLNSDGQIIGSTESVYERQPTQVTPFELSVGGQDSAYLVFNILNYNRYKRVNSCTLQVKSLAISHSQ